MANTNESVLGRLWREQSGQDLIEYTLLLSFVCIGAAAIFLTTGADIRTVWSVANSHNNRAAQSALLN